MTQNVLTADDFDRMLDNYAGRQVSHTPVVKTFSNLSGQETLTDGTAVTIKAYFMRTSQSLDYQKAGLVLKGNAVLLAKYCDGVTVNSIITADSTKYRVKEAFHVPGVYDSTGSGTTFVYTVCSLFLIE